MEGEGGGGMKEGNGKGKKMADRKLLPERK